MQIRAFLWDIQGLFPPDHQSGPLRTRDWKRQGNEFVMTHTLKDVEWDTYFRVRGTNTDEQEP